MSIVPTLAIDFGTKRVGLARSYASLAEPLHVVPNDEHLFEQIARVIAEEELQQVVVGISENEMAERSRTFGEMIQTKLRLPVFYMDETLSSKQVERQLSALGQTKPGQRPVVDHLAAATFLQEWLDGQAAGT